MKKAFLIIVIALSAAVAHGQLYLQPNEYQQRLNNGLQLFYTKLDGANQYEVMLAYKFGSMVEDSMTDGLAYVCHTVFINELQQQLKKVDGSIKIDGRFGHELCTYRFTVPKSKYSQALDAIALHYHNLPDSVAVQTAIAQNAALLSIIQNTLLYPAEQTLLNQHWGNRAPAMSIYGRMPVADSLTIATVKLFYQAGYCMESALMVYSGPEKFTNVWKIAQTKLGYIEICKGNGTVILMANMFSKPKLSTQLVYNVGSATPTRYQKLYHGPYISYDPEGVIAAQVLKTIFAQPNGLTSLLDSLSIVQVKLAFDPMKHTSGLTWHVFPKQDSLHVAYSNLDTLIALLADTAIIPTADIESAKTKLVKQFEAARKDPTLNAYLIALYWAQNLLPWLAEYPKMIESVDHSKISGVVKNYLLEKKYTTLLLLNDADSTSYDFNKYTATYSSIDNINLYFQKNTAKFASGADDSTLNALKQTLLINPNTIVAINAEAHKSEILDVRDDSLSSELSQYKDFYMYPMSLLGQKYYRLDMYRAATLMAQLLKWGIDPKQLKGTGVMMKGDDSGTYKATVTVAY